MASPTPFRQQIAGPYVEKISAPKLSAPPAKYRRHRTVSAGPMTLGGHKQKTSAQVRFEFPPRTVTWGAEVEALANTKGGNAALEHVYKYYTKYPDHGQLESLATLTKMSRGTVESKYVPLTFPS